jgi:ElaB/YqjD/DUF883 family membrane-anchored ribosome-binding protein
VGSLLVADHFPISFRAEHRFQAILNRFFRSCAFLLSTTGWPRDRAPTRLQQWGRAFHLNELALSPQKLTVWARALPAAALGNTTPGQVQDLVTSLQALSYRMKALVQVQAAAQPDVTVRKLMEDVRGWCVSVQEIFARLATKPDEAEYASFRSQLDSMLERLKTRIEETIDHADDRSVSTEEGENIYRLLGAHRGLSAALVDFIRQADAIDWTLLREARF